MKQIFNGLISESYEWNELMVDGKILSREIDFNNQMVNLKYFISETPIQNPVEAWLKYLYGEVEAENEAICGK